MTQNNRPQPAKEISSDKPLALFIGRKRQVVRKPWRVELARELETIYDGDVPLMTLPRSETLKLFIDDRLFSTTPIRAHSRYGRRAALLRKPQRGFIQLHLTKNQTDLAPS